MEKYISLSDLRKVKGIGDKTIERIKEQLLQNELDGNYKSEYNPNIKLDVNEIHQGDCLELMNGIPDKSIDMVLCDLPYEITRAKWDIAISLDKLWKQYNRIIKDNGVIVLTNSEPFGSHLRISNLDMYRYDLIWDKTRGTDPMNAKHRPMRSHECISIFYKKKGVYNPQMVPLDKPDVRKNNKTTTSSLWNDNGGITTSKVYTERYPLSIVSFPNSNQKEKVHPTQKPLALFEWLIKTYTNEGDLVLDNCIGSGTTAVACVNTNRNYIGIELDEEYYNIAKNRINKHIDKLSNDKKELVING